MSSGKNEPALAPLVAGSVLAAIGGGVLGGLVAVSSWTASDGASGILTSLGLGFLGAFVGAILSLLTGFVTGWNGAMVGCQPDRQASAPMWGLVAGVVVGFFIGPVFGGAAGIFVEQIEGGAYLGLFLGPMAGALAWQIGYWGSELLTPDPGPDAQGTSH